jgi:hypothetical protein
VPAPTLAPFFGKLHHLMRMKTFRYTLLNRLGYIGLWAILALTVAPVSAQTPAKFGYPTVQESQIIGSKWRYAYTLHLESNTTIHQAEKDYEFFLFLKYDFEFEQFLNGKFSKGNWSLSNGTLFYPFKNIQKFTIATISQRSLVLEFQQPNSPGTYQYHFTAVSSKESPFARPANELEEVLVEANPVKAQKRPWWAILQQSDKKEDAKPKKVPTYISVELIGGGYYGGIDPVIKDFTQIKTDGRLIHEFQTVNQPLRVVKKTISRTELEQFAEYVFSNKFFEMQRMYDCNTAVCEKRKMNKPTPIPLRLMVAYGDKRKIITISIWGQDNHHVKYVDYPPVIDNIVDAIQRITHRIEDKDKPLSLNK